jgi:heme/copper-type cytochrome/quinol oxidase subunit 2
MQAEGAEWGEDLAMNGKRPRLGSFWHGLDGQRDDVGNGRLPARSLEACGRQDRPLGVDVVAQHSKWLFLYPEQNIATVNELVLPPGPPLRLQPTSTR